MFYQPMQAALSNELLSGVLRAMWHLITIQFGLSALALFIVGLIAKPDFIAWLVAAQFAGYAALYLVISLRLGGPFKLFQWTLFGLTAGLAAAGSLQSS
jgi:hypothetical protein